MKETVEITYRQYCDENALSISRFFRRVANSVLCSLLHRDKWMVKDEGVLVYFRCTVCSDKWQKVYAPF